MERLTVKIMSTLCLFVTVCVAGLQQPLAAGLSAQQLSEVSAMRDSALNDDAGYHLVRDLTTEVGPRLAGSEADARAVEWTARRFRHMGFDRVWIEPVTFPRWVRGSERASIDAPYNQPLHITALGGSVGTDGPISAELVLFSDLAALQAADPALVEGKIAFIAKQMFRHIEGAGYGHAVAARSRGASIAADKGAVALLIRSVGTDSHRFPHTGMMSVEADIAAAALSNPDADQLERLLSANRKISVTLDIKAGFDGQYTSHNVIAELTGSEHPEQIILIGGHLDSWDLGTGAVDDGAGVGITAAAAYQFIRHNIRPKRSIRVVAFANEEQGLLGAEAYAQAHSGELINHLVASESDFGAGPVWSWQTKIDGVDPQWLAHSKGLLLDLGIAYKGNTATGGGPDIIPLYKKGVAVFRLNQDGTDYFDLHHTADDTFDKIDLQAFNQNVAAWTVMLYMFSQGWADGAD